MGFKVKDRVQVSSISYKHAGEKGTVTHSYSDGKTFVVKLDNGDAYAYFDDEMELDAEATKREALIDLAETLNEARKQANAIDELAIQSQHGVYGQTAQALIYTLAQIVGAGYDSIRYDHAGMVYGSILDGNTVREALASVVK